MKKFLAWMGHARDYLQTGMWRIDLDDLPRSRRAGLKVLRFMFIVGTGFVKHRVSLHAAGLTCFTLLALVPTLMLMLLLTKPCGVYDLAREKLCAYTDSAIEAFFDPDKGQAASQSQTQTQPQTPAPAAETSPAPEGAAKASAPAKDGAAYGKQVRDLRDQLLAQVDARVAAFNFGAMALVGILMLSWTVVSVFGQIEGSLNELWNVRRGRPIWKRFVLYASTLMVLPPLVTLAMSMPVLRLARRALTVVLGETALARYVDTALVGVLDSFWFSAGMVLLFLTLAFAFLFWAMPNRSIRLRSALWGGAVTVLMLAGWLKLCALLQIDLTKSGAAWGSFALIPILIVWIFMNWRIILLGSTVTYAIECIHQRVRALPVR